MKGGKGGYVYKCGTTELRNFFDERYAKNAVIVCVLNACKKLNVINVRILRKKLVVRKYLRNFALVKPKDAQTCEALRMLSPRFVKKVQLDDRGG